MKLLSNVGTVCIHLQYIWLCFHPILSLVGASLMEYASSDSHVDVASTISMLVYIYSNSPLWVVICGFANSSLFDAIL